MKYKTTHEYTDRLYSVISSYEESPTTLLDAQHPEVKAALLLLQEAIEKHAEKPPVCSLCFSSHWPETPCDNIIDAFYSRAAFEYKHERQLNEERQLGGG